MKLLNDSRKRLLVGFVAAIVLGSGIARADFTFGNPTNSGPTVNSPGGSSMNGDDFPNCFSADGLEMYIISRRTGGQGLYDIWVTQRETVDGEWGTPVNLGSLVNTSTWEWSSYLSADGLELYFDSRRSGGSGTSDIWITRRATKDDAWGIPENLGPAVNSSSGDSDPYVSPDGLELSFTSNRSGGMGDWDIWISRRATKDDPWEEPINLGSVVNSSAGEGWHSFSSDGLLLFLSEDATGGLIRPEGFGGSDLWMTRRATVSDPWGVPVNLGPIVNSPRHDCCPLISPDGSTLYFSSARPGGLGGPYYGDIWQAPIVPITDFNGDGKVDGFELCRMVDRWGTDDSLCDIGPMAWGDGIVDIEDLKVLVEYIGKDVDDPTFIAHWALDEIEGDVAYDSAAENDAVIFGGAIWAPVNGAVDGALNFDGIDDYIQTPQILNPAKGAFSVFAWIKGGAPGQVILSHAEGMDWLMIDPEQGTLRTSLTQPAVNIRGKITEGPVLTSLSSITDGNWYHVGLVRDGVNRILYVNDIEVARDAIENLESSAGGLYIGSSSHLGQDSFWSGMIDDVRIYNRVVTP
jgi:hypothetical protein